MTYAQVAVEESLNALVKECQKRIAALKQAIIVQKKVVSGSAISRSQFHEELRHVFFPQVVTKDESILIDLTNLSGESLHIKAGSLRTACDVKQEVATRWNVPIVCQKLLVGSEALDDDSLLSDLCKDSNVIPMSLVVSLGNAHDSLIHGNRSDRRVALQALAKVMPTDEKSLTSIHSLAADGAWEVRIAALDAIKQMSATGDETALSTVRNLLDDANAQVRLSALQALIHLAPAGSERCIVAATHTLLQDRSEIVRDGVIQTFATLSAEIKDHIKAEAKRLLLHSRLEVRLAALRALSSLAHSGDASSVDDVCACLDEHNEEICLEALRTLSHIASRGDSFVTDAVVARLRHPSAAVKLEALRTVESMGGRSDDRIVTGVSGLLEDLDEEVMHAAGRVLTAVSSVGDELTVVAIISRLHHKRAKVRLTALDTLASVARAGHERALSAVRSLFVDCNSQVRQRARQVAQQLQAQQVMKQEPRIKSCTLASKSPLLSVTCTDSDAWSVESETDDEDGVLFVGCEPIFQEHIDMVSEIW